MFIRQVKKRRSKSSKTFYQYNLVQSERADGKVKQRVILYLGSDPLMADKANRDMVLAMLKAKIFGQPDLFPDNPPRQLAELADQYWNKYQLRYGDAASGRPSVPPQPSQADYHHVDIDGVATRQVRSFGPEQLCRQTLERLDLPGILARQGFSADEAAKAGMAIAARAIYAASEHKTAEILQTGSALTELYDCSGGLTHKQLYRIADRLWEHRHAIDQAIYRRVCDLFNLDDQLVIYDLSNTYFETRKPDSELADYGRSKERRTDCPQVVFSGVINSQGFIRHSRIYQGSTADPVTVSDMLDDLAAASPPGARPTVVMDAGMATDDNLTEVRRRGYHYVCVSRHRLGDYRLDEATPTTVRLTDRGDNQVQLAVFQPPNQPDIWMQVQSSAKADKETSMQAKLRGRFEAQLEHIRAGLDKKGGVKKLQKVWERIGRAKQKYAAVAGQYSITTVEDGDIATDLQWKHSPDTAREVKTSGTYFIRTSYPDPTADQLWDIYNTIRQVEATFRCLKTDLNLRPVHHQNEARIQSHIYLTMLAYQLVTTIRYMLGQAGLRYDWNNIVRILSTHTIQTTELPTETKRIHIRKPSVPSAEANQIYQATGCTDTRKPIKKSVVYH